MCEIKKCYSETYCLQLLMFNHQGAKYSSLKCFVVCAIKGDILLQYSHVDIKMLIKKVQISLFIVFKSFKKDYFCSMWQDKTPLS